LNSNRILVFASRDSPLAAEARMYAGVVNGRFVDRLSTKLEDLVLVARYRVVEPLVVVVLVHDRVFRRYTELVAPEAIHEELDENDSSEWGVVTRSEVR
jgi:hypothetical protein